MVRFEMDNPVAMTVLTFTERIFGVGKGALALVRSSLLTASLLTASLTACACVCCVRAYHARAPRTTLAG